MSGFFALRTAHPVKRRPEEQAGLFA